ncbi:glycosyltransferase family 4 protein [Bacillus cereus group sp. TH152-1LC]|uniref:glycosyltransferase family 4 protein n=1 Tax=Bacillus cereus group sp. TH152-1LC TaxID=3018060 RepID=UPI0022E17AA2|nr:glycosyltransferase family 4 protein [Bacillus cereus group sp. TH152-1LC]MDA1679379.1 glycosyltransferase family 4 protein [Bacillus cereus group sp. TH152-1LC]
MRKIKILNVFPACEYGGTEKVIEQTAGYLIGTEKFEVGLCTVEGSKLEEFQNMGVSTYILKEFGDKYRIKRTINAVYESIRDFDPDVIHTHSLYSLLVVKILQKIKKNKIPVVHTGHGGPRKNYDLYASYLAKLANKYIVISKKSYSELSKKNSNIVLIENGIDLVSEEEVFEKIDNSEGKDILNMCYIGRLAKQKGLIELIDALHLLKQNNIKFKIKIIGSGELRNEIEQRVNQYQLDSNVDFIPANKAPWKKVNDIPIVLMPSIWEPGGIVAMEAISRNHTLIATMVGGLKELVVDAKNGYLVPPGNSEEIAKVLMGIYSGEKQHLNINMEERKKYLFANRTGKKIEGLYLDLLKDKGGIK